MKKHEIDWCANVVMEWIDENPSLYWSDIWTNLEECIEHSISKVDRLKIKQTLVSNDYF